MQLKKARVESALVKKGFKKSDADHHYFIYWSIDGRKTEVRTFTSHSKKVKDLDDFLIGEMARQCRLTKPKFVELVKCPLSRQQYEDELPSS